jgi:hypothetical protein
MTKSIKQVKKLTRICSFLFSQPKWFLPRSIRGIGIPERDFTKQRTSTMARYNKTFTVRAANDERLEVYQDGKLLYKLAADTWRKQLWAWRGDGWEIIWS